MNRQKPATLAQETCEILFFSALRSSVFGKVREFAREIKYAFAINTHPEQLERLN